MTPDLLKPLWHKLDSDPPCFFAEEFREVFAPTPKLVLDLRVLQQTTSSLTATCRECGSAHIGTVHHRLDRRTGQPTVHLACPNCGPTRIEPDELRRWIVDIPRLLKLVTLAVGGRGEPTELVTGHVWHLGNVTWCGRSRETYFVRCLHECSRAAITAALVRHPKAAIVFPTEAAARKWTVASNPVFALESILTFDSTGLKFDPTAAESRLAAAGLLDPVKRKRTAKRAARDNHIAKLIKELTEHLRVARDHAYTTLRIGGTALLLPRPTKMQLAARTKLSAPEVSRCFSDGSLTTLHLLWDTAADLGLIMKFKGHLRRGAEG